MQQEQTSAITFSEGFPVSVLMEYPAAADLEDEAGAGEAIGLVASAGPAGAAEKPALVRTGAGSQQYIWGGLRLQLFKDDGESYYMNLMGDQPRVFVVCRNQDDGRLRPASVTVSYDEAASYMEVDEPVFALPMPAEVYRWLEAYVLENFVPERKKKRRRDDWKKDRR